ncbi:MAG TPA: Gfo/Idh/MocA family oxidoreductase [Tepidisphaeraceae bacterium]|nr:Gfo/Idh/MocA family oxidoreductase [Tepidisphaeraceae bacterium]
MAKQKRDYALAGTTPTAPIPAPPLRYLPQDPKRYNPPIALIACGGITEYHLRAYQSAGYNVVALCDRDAEKAKLRQKQFYPDAEVYTDYRDVINRDDIEVLDVATHPAARVDILKEAIAARKHILSQKPFVTDLDVGQRLVELADSHGVRLAVNQNGRWAPHFAWMRAAIAKNLIGQPIAAHLGVHWDHNWVKGTPFETVRHIVLYDFAIHWFDIVTSFMGDRAPKRVFASNAVSPTQTITPPMLGQALIEYDDAQATLVFDADVRHGAEDRSYVAGTKGTLISEGPGLTKQSLRLITSRGVATPDLTGDWFTHGFHGTMAELLLSIEQKRQPSNNARDNLRSLALCFAACASADAGKPMTPGKVRKLPK